MVALGALRDRIDVAFVDAIAALPAFPRNGLSTRTLLATDVRLTRDESEAVHRVATARAKLPALDAAAKSGALSSAQVRAIATLTWRLEPGTCDLLDAYLAEIIRDSHGRDAEWVRRETIDVLALFRTNLLERDEDRANAREHLNLQPDLLGGGTFDGRLAAAGFQTLTAALARRISAETLLDASTLHATGGADRDVARDTDRQVLGSARAAALVAIAQDELTGTTAKNSTRPAVPTMLVTTTLEALAGITDEPGRLLSTIAGGAVNVSARTVRDWADFGADVRLIVHEPDGRHLGTGRLGHRPPGWLRDTIAASFPACLIPGCDAPAALCDLDHHEPFDDGGATTPDNLGHEPWTTKNLMPRHARPEHRPRATHRWPSALPEADSPTSVCAIARSCP